MPRQLYEIKDFSGGLNCYADPRDIDDSQFAQNWNVIVDKNGILRIIGSAVNHINTTHITNDNFQTGFGLFQFSTDYPINSTIDGTFNLGYEQGTVVSASSGSVFVIENTSTRSAVDDYYNGMTIFIYEGVNVGETRLISDYEGDGTGGTAGTVTVAAAFTATPTTTSKYMIFRWTSSNWETSDANKDFITNGIDIGYNSGFDNANLVENDYYLCTKQTASDETSSDLGYVEFITSGASGGTYLTLNQGEEYTFSFSMASKDKWYNLVSDGSADGTGTTYGDKLPWLQLYSTTVEDDSGALRSLDSITISTINVDTSVADTISAAWQTNQSHKTVSQTSTNGSGVQAFFNITTNASGHPTFRIIDGGKNYVVDEEIIVTDPGDTSSTATIKVEAVNNKGLSLYDGGWMTQNSNQDSTGDNATYLSKVDSNFIDNGDFKDGTSNNWSIVGGKVTATTMAVTEFLGGDAATASGANLTGSGLTYNDNTREPDSYLKTTNLTLDANTYHHLNFSYFSNYTMQTNQVMYAVYSESRSIYIVPWTFLDYTVVDVNNKFPSTKYKMVPSGPWKHVNQTAPHVNGKYRQNYVKFKTGISGVDKTESVTVRFSFSNGTNVDNYAAITGVTLHKAHHDLSTMSYTTDAVNPFFEKQKWSTYQVKFRIPDNYNKVSDWRLRIHGGKYGWRDGNLIEGDNSENATNTQEVYLDNINLISSSSEKHTLLSNNNNEGSKIALYNDNIWDGDFIVWPSINAKPVYNYINGMLKISDANFNTDNENKFAYFNNKRGNSRWIVLDSPLPEPPTITMGTIDAVEILDKEYNALPGLNELYSDKTYKNSLSHVSYGAKWRIDNYGSLDDGAKGTPSSGIPVRYTFDRQKQYDHDGNYASVSYILSNDGIYLDGGDYDYYWFDYQHHFHSGGFGSTYGGANGYEIGGWDWKPSGVVHGYGDLFYNANYMQNSWILGRDMEAFLESEGHDSSQISVHSIDYKVHWYMSCDDYPGWSLGASHHADRMRQPYFKIQAGVHNRPDLNPDNDLSIDLVVDTNDDEYAGIYDADNNGDDEYWGFSKYPGLERYLDDEHFANGDGFDEIADSVTAGGAAVHKGIKFEDTIGQWGNQEFIDEDETTKDKMYIPVKDGVNLMFRIGETKVGMTGSENGMLTPNGYLGDSESSRGLAGYYISSRIYDQLSYFPYNQGDLTNDWNDNVAFFTHFVYEKINVKFYNPRWESENIIPNGGNQTQIYMEFNTIGASYETSGWANRVFEISTSSVNVFDEESAINEGNVINTSDVIGTAQELEAPGITVILGKAVVKNDFIKETKYYMREAGTDIWYLQFSIKHDNESPKMYSSTSGKSTSGELSDDNNYHFTMSRFDLLNFNEVDSYESQTQVQQIDANNNSSLSCRYKTAVVCNNRLYVGNIKQAGRIYGDRMLKSPVGKYNLLPASNLIDVAINDGDEITALAYYKDKLIQFKKKKVFVINISGDYEFLEDTLNDIGVDGQFSVVTTQYGIVWANEDGCFLYDGEKLNDLTSGKIPLSQDYTNPTSSVNYWCSNASTGDCVVGYDRNKQTLLVNFTRADTAIANCPSGATYHFPTKSWALVFAVWGANYAVTNSGDM